MPAEADPAMAFVLVQHLVPDHENVLTDLIRRYTRMQASWGTNSKGTSIAVAAPRAWLCHSAKLASGN